MPAKSKNQQQIMGMALAYKRGELSDDEVSAEIIRMANSMTEKQLKDFAETKHDGLPDKIGEEELRGIIRDIIIDERYKKVVRNKKVKRKKECGKGKKAVGGKCVKMSSTEKRKRSKGAKKGSKKRSSKTSSSRKRKKSISKRKQRGL